VYHHYLLGELVLENANQHGASVLYLYDQCYGGGENNLNPKRRHGTRIYIISPLYQKN